MLKKLLYIYALTTSYALAVASILKARHDLVIGTSPLREIQLAFMHDGVLVAASMAGFVAYAAFMWRIMAIRVAPGRITPVKTEAVYGEPLLENQRGAIKAEAVAADELYPPQRAEAAGPAAEVAMVRVADVVELKPEQKVEAPVENPVIADVAMRAFYRVKIHDALAERAYKNLGEATIEGAEIDFVAIADSDVLALGIIDPTNGTISAGADDWYAESGKRYASPITAAARAVAAAKSMIEETMGSDNGIKLLGLVVVPNGKIANQSDLAGLEKGTGVRVTRFMNHTKLPDIMRILPGRKGTEILSNYEDFVRAMLDYFESKTGKKKAA